MEMIENFSEDRCQSWPTVVEGGLEVFFVFREAFSSWGGKQE